VGSSASFLAHVRSTTDKYTLALFLLLTSENQSTGLERFELLGKLEGIDVFDMKPLDVNRLGTVKEPIEVYSLVSVRSFHFR
jgi:hypothetical protein